MGLLTVSCSYVCLGEDLEAWCIVPAEQAGKNTPEPGH